MANIHMAKPGMSKPDGEDVKETVDKATDAARDAATSPLAENLARFGYVTKGAVYALVGILAALAAFGSGRGKTTTTQGAIVTISKQPFGQFLLVLIAIGLVGYVLYRFAQTFLDIDHDGTDMKGWFKRIGYAASGITYAGLAAGTVQILSGNSVNVDSHSQHQTEDWTAWLLAKPFGEWLVVLVGLVVIGVGLTHFYTAFTKKFREEFKSYEMSEEARKWALRFGMFGLSARGVVFCLIGLFLIKAAVDYNPKEAVGLGDALQQLAAQPFGPYLLGIVALGLISYGLYSFMNARYRRIGNS